MLPVYYANFQIWSQMNSVTKAFQDDSTRFDHYRKHSEGYIKRSFLLRSHLGLGAFGVKNASVFFFFCCCWKGHSHKQFCHK